MASIENNDKSNAHCSLAVWFITPNSKVFFSHACQDNGFKCLLQNLKTLFGAKYMSNVVHENNKKVRASERAC